MKNILFITGGSDSGSEHNLFSLMATLSREEAMITVLTRYNDYHNRHSISCQQYYSEESYLKGRIMLHRIVDRLFYNGPYFPFTRFFRHVLLMAQPDLIYCNLLTLPDHFDFFFKSGVPIIVHGHSLQQFLYAYPFPLLENRLKTSSLVLSSSEAQKDVMTRLVPDLKPEVIYPPVELQNLVNDASKRNQYRQKLNIPENAMVWVMASTYFNYNKDPDRFIEVGKRIIEQSERDVYFLWIGGAQNSTAVSMALSKVKLLGIEKHFIFTGDCSHQDYIRYLDAGDGLLLISLEESFSIVTAEAIAMGKPVVAFNCGGVCEIITEENGILVEPFSFEKMAEQACKLSKEINQYEPQKLRATVLKFSLESQAEQWKGLLLRKKL